MKRRRLVSLLLAGSMMVSMVPASAVTAFAAETKNVAVMAEDGDTATSAPCGAESQQNAVQWAFDNTTGVLTISGTGTMANYSRTNSAPWKRFANQITKIEIGEQVKGIGNEAFNNLSNLTTVNIPASIKSLGTYIFSGDTELTTVSWEEGFQAPAVTDVSVMSNGLHYTGACVPEGMFDGCTKLGAGVELNTWLPKSFNGVGCAAFRKTAFSVDFDKLESDGMKYYGAYAFFGMPNLESFTLTDNIRLGKLSDNAFTVSESGLKELVVNATTVPHQFAPNCKDLRTIVLSDNVSTVESMAFAGSGVTALDIPANITIGVDAFYNCTDLKKVVFHGYTVLEGNNTGSSAFRGCGIEKLEITDGAKVSCANNSFTGMNDEAVSTLKEIEVLGTLESTHSTYTTEQLWQGLFASNEALTKVTLSSENLQYLSNNMFPKVEHLSVVGENAELNESALVDYSNLETVDLSGCNAVTYENNCFGNGMNDNTTIYVKDASTVPGSDTGISENHGIVLVTNGGTVDTTKSGFDSVTKLGYTAEWYDGENKTTDAKPKAGHIYTVKWLLNASEIEPAAACKVTVENGTAWVDNQQVEFVAPGETVTIKANQDIVDGMKFSHWEVRKGKVELTNAELDETTFVMPDEPVEVAVMLKDESSDDGIDAATVVTGVVLGTGAAVLTYHIGTELYAEQVLGKGVAVPKTREEVALKAWELAGKPAVAIDSAPLSEAARAEKWAVASGLMQNDANGDFNGAKKMNKLKVLRVLDSAKKLNAQ